MRNQVFILGSCATRDAFEFVRHSYTLAGYICRTSLGSGFAPAPFDLTLVQLDPNGDMVSPFQRRMVEIDLAKGLAQALDGLNPESSIVVVDLIDERFHLLSSNGTLATLSAELQRSKPTERYHHMNVIKANTDQHFDIWQQGLDKLAECAQRRQIPVVLNKVFWAGRDTSGAEFNLPYVQASNTHLRRMYEAFQKTVTCAVIEYDRLPLADGDHKWGRAPFHYELGIYSDFMAQLDAILGSV